MTTRTMTEKFANDMAPLVRLALNLPDDWVRVENTQDEGWTIVIALNMYAHVGGDAETGPQVSIYPTRWVHVYEDVNGFVCALYDSTHVTLEDESSFEFTMHPRFTQRLTRALMWSSLYELIDHDPAFAIERDVQVAS